MTYFQNLNQIVGSLEADASTKNDPIKRTFVIDGGHLTANVAIVRDSGNALHTQRDLPCVDTGRPGWALKLGGHHGN